MAHDIFPYAFAPYCAVLKADAKPSPLRQLYNLIAEIFANRGARSVRGDL